MTKVINNPKEKMRMNIEMADNGIIIRNPDCEDEVTLAMNGGGTRKADGYGYDIDHSDEYKAIGKKVYDWLMNEVVNEHTDFIITNLDIDIVATCKGHDFR